MKKQLQLLIICFAFIGFAQSPPTYTTTVLNEPCPGSEGFCAFKLFGCAPGDPIWESYAPDSIDCEPEMYEGELWIQTLLVAEDVFYHWGDLIFVNKRVVFENGSTFTNVSNGDLVLINSEVIFEGGTLNMNNGQIVQDEQSSISYETLSIESFELPSNVSNLPNDMRFEVYNTLGQTVLNGDRNANVLVKDLFNRVPNNVFIVRLYDQNRTGIKKYVSK